MAKISLSNVLTLLGINSNFQKLEDELNQKVLYRDNPDGEPNTMEVPIDLNGNSLLNADAVHADSLILDGVDVEQIFNNAVSSASASAASAASSASSAASSAASAANAAAYELATWAYSQTFQLVSATRDSNGAITTAIIKWPDGKNGVFTTDVASTSFPGAIDAWHASYLGTPSKTITQPAVTRDSNGAVTVQPAITIS